MASRVPPPTELVGYIASVDAPSPLRAEGRVPSPVVRRAGRRSPFAILVAALVVLVVVTCIVGLALALHGTFGPLPANRISSPTSRRPSGDPSAPLALLH